MYADFLVSIGTGEKPGPFPVEVVSSPAGPADGQMVLPEGFDEQLAALGPDAPDPNALQQCGSMLFRALFSGEVGRAWNEIQNLNLGRKAGGLRLRLRIDDPGLERLPWELLHDGRSFLATNPDLLFSRYPPVSEQPSFDRTAKLRVLTVLEGPEMLPPMPPEFTREFESSLTELAALGIESRVLKNASIPEIRSALQEGFDVLHLVAHGSDSTITLVGDDHKSTRTLDGREFAQLLPGRLSPPLVFLNACRSAEGDGGGVFSGLAASLVSSGVPAVVAMQYPIVRQSSATIFTRALYASLANGLPVDAGVKEARRMLWSGGHPLQPDWSSPILYLGTPSAKVASSGNVVADHRSQSAVPHDPHPTHPCLDPDTSTPQEASRLEAKLCEEFQGFVEKIEGDKAYVRLDSRRGERLCGPYPADELQRKGIGERDRFLLRAIERDGAIRFDAELIPRKKVTPERQKQIREEIDAALEGFTPDDER